MERAYSKDLKVGDNVKLAGWVHEIRDFGKLIFLIVRDMHGLVQVTAKTGETDDKIVKEVKDIGKEFVIEVEGKAEKNDRAPNGMEVKPTKITIISESESPLPLESTGKVNSDLDTRLDNRFLDLRRPEVRAIFTIQNQIIRSFRKTLEDKEFIEITPPGVIAASSEGGAELFPIPYYNKEAFLAQSPQIYKQMAVMGGMEKVSMITPVWRAEKSNTVRHLSEARQMDIEMGFATDVEAMDILDDVTFNIFSDVKKTCESQLKLLGTDFKIPKLPLKKITYTDVLKRLEKEGMKIKWGEDLSTPAEKKICELVGWDEPFYITEWPTDIRAFYSMPDEKDPKICRAFDLMFRGVELLSGAQRIHIPELLIKRLKAKGMDPENFKFYIDTFRYGAPPHAGWSIGLERITMLLTARENIREACLFPRDPKRLTP
ncbi:MAG: aspartate--tRNA(Asn) ligase [Candidatus Aenigmarchaeota archaeon]|nr:aspartate--tRNA(Asn) ligase [Candidatus Aenigmarchaeota archaeon]